MTAATKTQRALPERHRQARNVHEGYEIRLACGLVEGDQHWLPVVKALHIYAPMAIARFELDWSGTSCVDGDAFVVRLDQMVYSRRPAVSA